MNRTSVSRTAGDAVEMTRDSLGAGVPPWLAFTGSDVKTVIFNGQAVCWDRVEGQSGCKPVCTYSDSERGRAAKRIKPAIRHMVLHLDQSLRIGTLCAVAGVSASSFFALFKSVTGRSPMDFFTRLRMQRACELLRDGKLSVKQAAAVLGYQDPYYFSRVFKLVTGIAPVHFSRLALAADGGRSALAERNLDEMAIRAAGKPWSSNGLETRLIF